MRTNDFSLKLLISSFLISLVFIEIGLRVFFPQSTGPCILAFNPELGPIPAPNRKGKVTIPGVLTYTFTNNSIGLRGSREYTTQDAIRILFLGDSFTWGVGVDDDKTFAYLVEKKLKENNYVVETINAGNPDTGTDYALKFYNYVGYKFFPQIVVLCFYANDFNDNAKQHYYEITDGGNLISKDLGKNSLLKIKAFIINSKLYNWIISWSHIANLLKDVTRTIILKYKLVKEGSFREGDYSNKTNTNLTRILIEHLRNEIIKNHSILAICYITSKFDYDFYNKYHHYSKDEENIAMIAKNLNVPFISCSKAILESGKTVDQIYYHELHWNSIGHQIASNVISDYLLNIIREKHLQPNEYIK